MSKSFAVLEQFCYWPPGKFKGKEDRRSTKKDPISSRPCHDALLRFDVRRRIEIDFSDPLSLTERQSKAGGRRSCFCESSGIRWKRRILPGLERSESSKRGSACHDLLELSPISQIGIGPFYF